MSIFFKNTEHLKRHYIEFNGNIEISDYENLLLRACNLYITPFLGETLVNALSDISKSEQYPNDITKKICLSLCDALSNYFKFIDLPNKNFIISAATAKASSNGTSLNMTIPDIKFRQSTAINIADASLDVALNLILANKSVFPTFNPALNVGCNIIQSTNDLENIINVKGFRAFYILSKYLRDVEEDELFEFCTIELINSNNKIKKFAQKFIAYCALALALPAHTFAIDAHGIRFVTTDAAEDKREHINNANDKKMQTLILNANEQAKKYKEKILNIINPQSNNIVVNKSPTFHATESSVYISR